MPPAPPVITGISPALGDKGGNITMFINGSGFLGATDVELGGTPFLSFTVDSDNQITAVTPPKAAGPWDVVVTTPGGSSALSPDCVYTSYDIEAFNWTLLFIGGNYVVPTWPGLPSAGPSLGADVTEGTTPPLDNDGTPETKTVEFLATALTDRVSDAAATVLGIVQPEALVPSAGVNMRIDDPGVISQEGGGVTWGITISEDGVFAIVYDGAYVEVGPLGPVPPVLGEPTFVAMTWDSTDVKGSAALALPDDKPAGIVTGATGSGICIAKNYGGAFQPGIYSFIAVAAEAIPFSDIENIQVWAQGLGLLTAIPPISADTPVITSVFGPSGDPTFPMDIEGGMVTFTGSNFLVLPLTISVDGFDVPDLVVLDDNTATGTVQPLSVGVYDVTATNSAGSDTLVGGYEAWYPGAKTPKAYFDGGYTVVGANGVWPPRSSSLGIAGTSTSSGGSAPTISATNNPTFTNIAPKSLVPTSNARWTDLCGNGAGLVGSYTMIALVDVASIPANSATSYLNDAIAADSSGWAGIFLGAGGAGNKKAVNYFWGGGDVSARAPVPDSGRIFVGARRDAGTTNLDITVDGSTWVPNGPTGAAGGPNMPVWFGLKLDGVINVLIFDNTRWSDADVLKTFQWAANRYP